MVLYHGGGCSCADSYCAGDGCDECFFHAYAELECGDWDGWVYGLFGDDESAYGWSFGGGDIVYADHGFDGWDDLLLDGG